MRPITMVRLAVGVLLGVGAGAGPGRSESVESPAYASWARHRVGTTIVVRSITKGGEAEIETITRSTLKRIAEDRVVLELSVTSNATGERIESPPDEVIHRRWFPILPGVRKEEIGKPAGAIDQGSETIQVAGKAYQATWYDTKGQTEAGPSFTRTWMSSEVPGRLLKAVTRVPAAKKTITVEVIALREG